MIPDVPYPASFPSGPPIRSVRLVGRRLGSRVVRQTSVLGFHYAMEHEDDVLQWPRELPAGGEPARNVETVERIGEWVGETEIPMLFFWARPGALNDEGFAEAMEQRVENIQIQFIGPGSHYVQEDQPEIIGRTLADWRRRLEE